MAVAALVLPLTAWAGGFRGDGTARFPTAEAPERLDVVAWRTPLDGWSNASPVRVADLVCVEAEPVTLACLDARTGAVRFRKDFQVLDALPAMEQAKLRPTLAGLGGAGEALTALHAEQSRLQRAARSGDATAEAALGDVTRRTFELAAKIDAWRQYLTPPDQEMIGWSTPTPATDGHALFVLFGNGVVARVEADGRTAWSRWLGPPPTPMRGYPIGTAASPQLVGGVLVVPYGDLRGLDPVTGADRWVSIPWRDFGTPAVAHVGGDAWLLTPDGHAVRARDGVVGLEHLADVAWSSPTATGDRVWFAGAVGDAHSVAQPFEVRALRLSPSGSGLRGDVLWTTTVPAASRVYASPLVSDGLLIVVDDVGTLSVLDADLGTLLQQVKLGSWSAGHTPSPVLVGDVVIVGSERAGTDLLRLGPAGVTPIATQRLEGYRSTPLPDGGRLYVRTAGGVVAIGR